MPIQGVIENAYVLNERSLKEKAMQLTRYIEARMIKLRMSRLILIT